MNSKSKVFAAVMVTITLGTTTIVFPSYAQTQYTPQGVTQNLQPRSNNAVYSMAPAVISGNHVYITWFTNEGTVNSNYEVGFRASNDSGATFGPIMNLSNTANSDSINAEIAADGKSVIVSWWEKNQTSMVPVAKVSTDWKVVVIEQNH